VCIVVVYEGGCGALLQVYPQRCPFKASQLGSGVDHVFFFHGIIILGFALASLHESDGVEYVNIKLGEWHSVGLWLALYIAIIKLVMPCSTVVVSVCTAFVS